jgi:hypothetical protein
MAQDNFFRYNKSNAPDISCANKKSGAFLWLFFKLYIPTGIQSVRVGSQKSLHANSF